MEHPITVYRHAQKLTQDAFGGLVGATKGMVSKWEARQVLPRAHYIVRIEDATDMQVSASDLVRAFDDASTIQEAVE